MNLLEAYKKRLSVSESVYKNTHNGDVMDNHRKIAIAKCLENTNKFLTEAFDAASATQRADMGMFKKFCLNLTTVALPNLIAHDLVIVSPMSSMSGYITYLEYQSGVAKGGVEGPNFPGGGYGYEFAEKPANTLEATEGGRVFNSPFGLGNYDEKYTSNRVVESVDTFVSGTTKVAWHPVIPGSVRFLDADGNELTATGVDVAADGTVTATIASGTVKKIAYAYDNIVVPQEKIPTLKAVMKAMPLIAKARRIAVYYSQIAAFQAKQDYGFDLGDKLAEQAVGQLSYEIDTEIVTLLDANAAQGAGMVWSKQLPVGVSKAEHYEGFSEIIEIGKQIIYDRTKRFAPNYLVIASNVFPILTFMKGFQAAPATNINGPYFAGTLNGLKVFVSPALAAGRFFLGVNGEDLMSSAAVYAPYMAIVPTQLLGFADGLTTQGFSTLYDLKLLNANLLVSGEVVA